MNIVIAGDGKVGSALAESLQNENHNVTVIDNNADALRRSLETLDIISVRGNAATYTAQTEAGVPDADLFIAVTSTDELNMLCCMLAKKLGAKGTIARLRNPDYIDQIHLLQEDLGLNMAVNPERAAARDMMRTIVFSSASNREIVAKGKADFFEFRIEEGSPLADRRLSELRSLGVRVLICAVERDGEAFIPNGDFILRVNDKIHVIGSSSDVSAFLKFCGKKNRRLRSVLIVGGGKVGFYLADMLLERGLSVRIVEKDADRCQELSEILPNALIIQSDGTDQDLLTSEDLCVVDCLVAATNIDEQNLIISAMAQHHGVSCVLTKLSRSDFRPILDRIGIHNVVIPRLTAVDIILQYVRAMKHSLGDGVKSLHRIIGDQVELLEFIAGPEFRYLRKPLMSIPLKRGVLVAAISHSGTLRIPKGDSFISQGDTVVIVTKGHHFSELKDIYN